MVDYKKIVQILNNPQFLKLKEYISTKSVFGIFGNDRIEASHSNFLAWLLDRSASHHLSEKPLRLFLKFLIDKIPERYQIDILSDKFILSYVSIKREHSIELANADTESGFIDVFIKLNVLFPQTEQTRNINIAIENKVDSREHDEQTKKYWNYLEQRFRNDTNIGVYLHVKDHFKDDAPSCKDFVDMYYDDFVKYIIDPLLATEIPEYDNFVLEQYLRCLVIPSKFIDKGTNSTKSFSMAKNIKFRNMLKELIGNDDFLQTLFDAIKEELEEAGEGEKAEDLSKITQTMRTMDTSRWGFEYNSKKDDNDGNGYSKPQVVYKVMESIIREFDQDIIDKLLKQNRDKRGKGFKKYFSSNKDDINRAKKIENYDYFVSTNIGIDALEDFQKYIEDEALALGIKLFKITQE